MRSGDQAIDLAPIFYFGKKNPQKKSEPDPNYALFSPPLPDGGEPLPLISGVTVEIQTISPVDGPDFIILPRLLHAEEQATVAVEVVNETQGEVLKRWSTRFGTTVARPLRAEKTREGDLITIKLIWEESPPPRIQMAIDPPLHPLQAKDGEIESEVIPIFVLLHDWPTRKLLWLWILVPASLLLSIWRKKSIWSVLFLVTLTVAAFASSALAWQQNYSHQGMHLDPDHYGAYGEKMASWLRSPEDRLETSEWIGRFPHAHIALTPILIAVGMLVGLSKPAAFLLVVGFATATTMAMIHHHLAHQLKFDRATTHFGLLLFGTQLLFLKSAGWPSSDALGMTTTVALMVCLFSRWKLGPGWKNNCLLSIFLLLAALARPSGITYFAPVAVFLVGIDFFRQGRPRELRIVALALGAARVIAPPLLALAGLYYFFDWHQNFQLSLQKSKTFQDFSTFPLFCRCLVPLFFIFPIFWFWLKRAAGGKSDRIFCIVLYSLWLVFYIGMLWAVKAPFIPRLFLPAVPSVALLTILAISFMGRSKTMVAFPVIIASAALSVAVIIYIIYLPFLPAIEIAPFIY